MILDSGTRLEFDSGAVRDMKEGKGRCDLLPLDTIADWLQSEYKHEDEVICLMSQDKIGKALYMFCARAYENHPIDMMLEVSKHFEAGAKKYGEYNWQKGIPLWSYKDSAIRHYLKWLRGDKDEPHDRAFVWNCLCYMWTEKHVTVDVSELKERC